MCVCVCARAEWSAYEESICNDGSICGSDSTFYRQTEGESVFATLKLFGKWQKNSRREKNTNVPVSCSNLWSQQRALLLSFAFASCHFGLVNISLNHLKIFTTNDILRLHFRELDVVEFSRDSMNSYLFPAANNLMLHCRRSRGETNS